MLDELGGMDEDFFLYYEEVALCRSARRRGWRVEYDPTVEVVHLRPLQNRPVSPKMRVITRHSKLLYFRKHLPALAVPRPWSGSSRPRRRSAGRLGEGPGAATRGRRILAGDRPGGPAAPAPATSLGGRAVLAWRSVRGGGRRPDAVARPESAGGNGRPARARNEAGAPKRLLAHERTVQHAARIVLLMGVRRRACSAGWPATPRSCSPTACATSARPRRSTRATLAGRPAQVGRPPGLPAGHRRRPPDARRRRGPPDRLAAGRAGGPRSRRPCSGRPALPAGGRAVRRAVRLARPSSSSFLAPDDGARHGRRAEREHVPAVLDLGPLGGRPVPPRRVVRAGSRRRSASRRWPI